MTRAPSPDRVSQRFALKKYEGIDFKPPVSVAAAAEKGLEYRQKSGKGGLTTEEAGKSGIGSGVQRAVNLKNRDTISPEVIRQMNGFFSRHEKNKSISPENRGTPWEDAGHVAWLLWGGDPGRAWAKKILSQMERADGKAKAKKALKMPAEFGIKTLVRQDDGPENTAPDRTPEQALPLPGSATPGGEGRDIPKFEFNTPDNDISTRMRTVPEPGEDRGHPVNETYNQVTRRTMTSSQPRMVWDSEDADNDPWDLAQSVGVNILSNKEFQAGFVVDGQMVAALFDASDSDGYEFDIVVDPAWQNKRLGSKLMDLAIDQYEDMVDAYGEDFTFNLDVINPVAVRMLKQRGFKEVGRERGHVLMTKAARFQQRWKPGKRQRRQRGKTRIKSKQYYRKNRSKILRKQKIRRSKGSYKNNPARKRSEKRRRKQNRRRVGSQIMVLPCPGCVAARHLEAAMDAAPPRERGGEGGKPQRKQPIEERREDRLYYRRNRNQIKRDNKINYKRKCTRNRNCMKRREQYRKDPDHYQRRAPKQASVLTVPDIAFVIGPSMVLGYVNSVSPMTGMVTFRLDDVNVSQLNSMPVEVFLRSAILLSDEDTTAFFELVDVEVGLEAYEDLDEEGLRECAGLYDVDPDSEAFRAQCLALVGESDISSMSAEQLDTVNDGLVVGVLEGGGAPRNEEGQDADEYDETISDLWDPHLYYGEVEAQKTEQESVE